MEKRLAASNLGVTLTGPDRSFRLIADGLELAAGEVVAITGASGSGKTLLLELIGLLRRPDAGSSCVLTLPDGPCDLMAGWVGADQGARMASLRREVFGFVPQSGGLLPFLNVAGNIALSQRLSNRPDPVYLKAVMARLGLAGRGAEMPDALSIGERQRVAIARALVHRPAIVIADEPTAALDPRLSREVMALLLSLAAQQGTAVILSTHDRALVTDLGIATIACEIDHGDSAATTVVSRLICAQTAPLVAEVAL